MKDLVLSVDIEQYKIIRMALMTRKANEVHDLINSLDLQIVEQSKNKEVKK